MNKTLIIVILIIVVIFGFVFWGGEEKSEDHLTRVFDFEDSIKISTSNYSFDLGTENTLIYPSTNEEASFSAYRGDRFSSLEEYENDLKPNSNLFKFCLADSPSVSVYCDNILRKDIEGVGDGFVITYFLSRTTEDRGVEPTSLEKDEFGPIYHILVPGKDLVIIPYPESETLDFLNSITDIE